MGPTACEVSYAETIINILLLPILAKFHEKAEQEIQL